jgi:hypothetical protein
VEVTHISDFGTNQPTNSVAPFDIKSLGLLKKPVIFTNEIHLQIASMARRLHNEDEVLSQWV